MNSEELFLYFTTYNYYQIVDKNMTRDIWSYDLERKEKGNTLREANVSKEWIERYFIHRKGHLVMELI